MPNTTFPEPPPRPNLQGGLQFFPGEDQTFALFAKRMEDFQKEMKEALKNLLINSTEVLERGAQSVVEGAEALAEELVRKGEELEETIRQLPQKVRAKIQKVIDQIKQGIQGFIEDKETKANEGKAQIEGAPGQLGKEFSELFRDTFKDFFKNLLKGELPDLKSFGKGIGKIFERFGQRILDGYIKFIENKLLQIAGEVVQSLFDRGVEIFKESGILEAFEGIFKDFDLFDEDALRGFFKDMFGKMKGGIKDFFGKIKEAIGGLFGEGGIFGEFDLFGSIKELFGSFDLFGSIKGLFGGLFDSFKGILGSLGSSLGGFGSSFGGFLGSAASAIAGFFLANGGVMTGQGPVPLRRFAFGGIANSPTMALFGEGSTPEAFVPLPDGRRIPVAMNGGGAEVNVNIVNNTGEPVRTQEQRRPGGGRDILVTVGEAMARDVNRGGPLSRSIQQTFGLQRRGASR